MNPSQILISVLAFCSFAMAATPLTARADSPKNPKRTIVQDRPPEPQREFRGVWVATVANIDWPSKPGLSTSDQQSELIAILDHAVRLHLNAVIIQVRPACDALYESKIEPWSEYLTGQQGKPPSPYYDPLEFAVAEAHRRGLELHAWFNPYRARHSDGHTLAGSHVSRTHPDLVRAYGHSLWLDPGSEAVQDYTVSVIMDVVKRYDIDGVHIDDYFYPYKEVDANKHVIPFPDDATWQAYLQSGGNLSREDWRRENVNTLIERLYREIKRDKSWVKFGISPFGIWRPGYPAQIKGFDAFDQLYADSRKWIQSGWCDYLSPQLYWPIKQPAQSYTSLLKWWVDQNAHGRHIWPGNYTSRVGDGSKNSWSRDEIVQQVESTRSQNGATGNVHFSMKPLLQNRAGVTDALIAGPYDQPALVPASPWLKDHTSNRPKFDVDVDDTTGKSTLTWSPGGKQRPWLWVLQIQKSSKWTTLILPGDQKTLSLTPASPEKPPEAFALSAVNRTGERSQPVVITP